MNNGTLDGAITLTIFHFTGASSGPAHIEIVQVETLVHLYGEPLK